MHFRSQVCFSYLDTRLAKVHSLGKRSSASQFWNPKEKLSAFEKKSHNRFELADRFIKSSINNMELANEGIPEKVFREFKKVGSNFQIKDRTVLFEPRGAWLILAESGFFGGNAEQTALRADHIFGSETLFEKLRRGRDSNSRCLAAYSLSKRAH